MMLPSILPEAYKRAALVVAVLLVVVALVAYGRGLGLKEGALELETARGTWLKQKAEAEAANRAKEQQIHADYASAIAKGIERENSLRDAFNAARSSSDGLRGTVATLRGQLSDASAASARLAADTALAVFGECSSRYGAVAEAADRHASDAATCRDAWPE